ncbi:MAG TPA: alpha/beta fold hydrolase [Polyangiaceae bacterium]|nr:alpha/beta fold hydrolase [Polyangiaceae bacterium]
MNTRVLAPPVTLARLICLPHAGASASVYGKWQALAPSWFEISGLELPGRGRRASEAPARDLGALSEQLAREIALESRSLVGQSSSPHVRHSLARCPYALFGHSMGAVLAFEIVDRLRAFGAEGPIALFVSGREAPDLRRPTRYRGLQGDAELVAELRRLGGTPELIFQNRDLLEMTLAVLRADFAACANYRYRERPPYGCPLHALGGLQDRATPSELGEWARQTSSTFTLTMFEGGHFFHHRHTARVVSMIAERVREALPENPVRFSAMDLDRESSNDGHG